MGKRRPPVLPLSGAQIAASIERHVAPEGGIVQAVWAIGSAGRAATGAYGDLNFAFLVPQPRRPSDSLRVFEAAEALAFTLGCDVALIDLAAASDVVRAHIVTGGHCIYAIDESAMLEFGMYALSDYARLNEERREVVESLLDRYRS